jgi:hypothetical protein
MKNKMFDGLGFTGKMFIVMKYFPGPAWRDRNSRTKSVGGEGFSI